MVGQGMHFALSADQEARLLAAEGDEPVVMDLMWRLEEAWDQAHLVDTDRAWDTIHRCLSDGTMDPEGGSYPLSYAILGGRLLHTAGGFMICYVFPDEVEDIAEALQDLDEAWWRDRLLAVNPGDDEAEQFAYVWENFERMRAFFQQAAKEARSVIFTGDL